MQDNLSFKKITLDKPEGKPERDGWSDDGCREAGSQKLEEQDQG
jgi:hypothetical protein